MNKAWLFSLLLGVSALWVAGATFTHHNPEFRFLDGAQPVDSEDLVLRINHPTHVEGFNVHQPFDETWSKAETELCNRRGWRLGQHSNECQYFVAGSNYSISLVRGKVDNHNEFVPGTEGTDTYVEIRTPSQVE